MVVMLLPGIPICYYGDELGMGNGIIKPEEIKDSFALRTKPVSGNLFWYGHIEKVFSYWFLWIIG